MNKGRAARGLRVALILLIALLALALLAFMLLRVFGRSAETPAVELPPPRAEEVEPATPAPDLPQAAEVTPETAVAVLRTLDAAASYSRAVFVDTFWEGGGGSEVILCWVKGDSLRLRSDSRNLLATPAGLWIWYGDGEAVFAAGSAAAAADYARYQRCLDWEPLLENSEIVAAAYTSFEDEPCVYVASRGGAFDYVTEIYVSLRSGLLVAADSYEGEKCVYRMRSGSLDLSTPDESWFVPPTAGTERG